VEGIWTRGGEVALRIGRYRELRKWGRWGIGKGVMIGEGRGKVWKVGGGRGGGSGRKRGSGRRYKRMEAGRERGCGGGKGGGGGGR